MAVPSQAKEIIWNRTYVLFHDILRAANGRCPPSLAGRLEGPPNAHAHAILAGIGNCDGPGGHPDCSIVLLRFG